MASQNPYPIIVYSVASYRPHDLSHFWANANVISRTEFNASRQLNIKTTAGTIFQPRISLFLTLFRLGFFGVPGPGGGGGFKSPPPPPLINPESIDAIVMKLGGQVEHYYLINFNRLHTIMTSWWRHNDVISPKSVFLNIFILFLCRRPTQPKAND